MIYVFLVLWIISAAIIAATDHYAARLVIYFGVFSLICAGCFVVLSAPDVALAQIVVGIFTTIIFLVALEKHYALSPAARAKPKRKRKISRILAPLVFTVVLALLFILFIPSSDTPAELKDLYLANFSPEVGGQNAVTAIYLGYRVYDTIFEALMLLIGVLAVIHLSEYEAIEAKSGKPSDIHGNHLASFTIRLICPLLLICGMYITLNGHLSPGGGFQGGVIIASFIVCRYMIYNIYDIPIGRVIAAEKIFFLTLIVFASVFLLGNNQLYGLIPHSLYLITMNALIGIKVACGFTIIFYRFIVFEREGFTHGH